LHGWIEGEGVAEKRLDPRYAISLEYCFDRLLDDKLAQAYGLLVPEKHWPVGRTEHGQEVLNAQSGCDLRASFVGPAERGSHNPESDGRADPIRRGTKLRRSS
jgi:hypothetical protein